MDALIFAAGRGTRLGGIGRQTPKALLDVGGRTMLEHVSRRLIEAGVDRIIINVHHRAGQIERFLKDRDLGVETVLSYEVEHPLETGGGLLHARALFRGDAPFFLHNVDVISGADLRAMYAFAKRSGAVAVLAVNERDTARHLLFDEAGLFGRSDARDGTRIEVRAPLGQTRIFAFAGIHVATPQLLERIEETGVFSILEPYMRLAGKGERILPFPVGEALWLEVGNEERLEAARAALRGGEQAFPRTGRISGRATSA